MITISKLAKEIGVTSQAIYKKLSCQPVGNLVEKDTNGKWLINEEAIEIIKGWFNNSCETVEQKFNQVDNQLRVEIDELKRENKQLQERIHEQSDQITEFAKQFAELSKNNQVLLGIEQNKTSSKMIETNTKKGFWNIFKRKKFIGET